MKKKILGIISAVLCLSMLLTSCGAKKFDKVVVDPYKDTTPTLVNKSESTIFSGDDVNMSTYETNGDYVMFWNSNAVIGEKEFVLYNALTGSTVKTWDAVQTDGTVSYKQLYDGSVIEVDGETAGFVVQYEEFEFSTDMFKYYQTVYTLDGVELYTTEKSQSSSQKDVSVKGNSVFFDGQMFKFANKTLTKVNDYNAFKFIPSIDDHNDTYLYDVVKSNGEIDRIIVYDYDFNAVGTYIAPACKSTKYYILENGNILFQGSNSVPENEKEFDYIDVVNGLVVKKIFVTELYNVEKGKVKKLDVNYKINEVKVLDEDSDYNIFGDKVKNLISITENVDNYLLNSTKMLVFDNNGKISDGIPKVIENQDEIFSADIKGRYVAVDKSDNMFLINETGAVLGCVTSIAHSNNKNFIYDGKIYDYNLAEVKSIPKDYSYYGNTANTFIFKEQTGEIPNLRTRYYALKDGDFVKIADSQSNTSLLSVEDQYYVIEETLTNNTTGITTYEYEIFNEAGTSLKVIESDVYITINKAITADNGSYVLLYTSSGKVVKLGA